MFCCIIVLLFSVRGHALSIESVCPGFEDECLVAGLIQYGREEGLVSMLRAVHSSREDTRFRASCARIMNDVGASLADVPVARWHPDAVSCNYGFIQGYVRAQALKSLTDAAQVCEAVRRDLSRISQNAYSECFRGIGSALIDIEGPGVEGDASAIAQSALGECDAADDPEAARFCAAGFFNALGFAMVNGRYGLEIDRTDPLWLCDEFDGELRYRCTGNMKWIGVRLVEGADHRPDIIGSYERARVLLKDELVLHVVRTLAYEYGRLSIPAEQARGDCAAVPASMQSQCAAGYALGMAKNGAREDYPRILKFCAESIGVLETNLNDCVFDVFSFLRGFMSPDEFAALCATLANHGLHCEDLSRPRLGI